MEVLKLRYHLQHGVQVLELMARDVFGLELAEDVLRLPAFPLLLLQHQLAELVTLRLQQLNRCYFRTFRLC